MLKCALNTERCISRKVGTFAAKSRSRNDCPAGPMRGVESQCCLHVGCEPVMKCLQAGV